MKKNWTYHILWYVTWPFVSLVYPRRTYGREKVPKGVALVCANHSSAIDPFLIAYSAGVRHPIRFMAKAELFKIPFIGFILRALGMFPVDRQGGGAGAIKGAMKYLKAGDKVGMFPEGTRISSEEASAAKNGAVRLAAKMGVPVVPVYVVRDKKVLRRNLMVFGEPYLIEVDKKTAKQEDYDRLAAEMMEKIRLLGENRQ